MVFDNSVRLLNLLKVHFIIIVLCHGSACSCHTGESFDKAQAHCGLHASSAFPSSMNGVCNDNNCMHSALHVLLSVAQQASILQKQAVPVALDVLRPDEHLCLQRGLLCDGLRLSVVRDRPAQLPLEIAKVQPAAFRSVACALTLS